MLEQIDALWTAVRKLQAQVMPLIKDVKEEPPPVPIEDPEKAKTAYEAAEAEVKAQQEHGALMVKWAQENAAKAKLVLDASTKAHQQQEQAAAQAQRQQVTPEPSDARRK